MVTANIVDDLEPSIQGLYRPSIVVEKNGRKMGIIGVILADTKVPVELIETQFVHYTIYMLEVSTKIGQYRKIYHQVD